MYKSVLRRCEIYTKPSGQQSEHFLQLLQTLSACQLVNSVSLEVEYNLSTVTFTQCLYKHAAQ